MPCVNGDVSIHVRLAKIRPKKIQSPEPITIKFGTTYYVHDTNIYPKFVQISRKGAPGQIREIYQPIFIFLQTRLLRRPVIGGFWLTIAQITRNHTWMCVLEIHTMVDGI